MDRRSGEFLHRIPGNKEADKEGEHRDAEKGKHLVRFCEREREAFANVEMQRRRRASARFTRLKMRP